MVKQCDLLGLIATPSLRFDPNFKAHRTLDAAFAREIVNGALTEDLKIYDLTGLRTQLYEKKLKSRMETFNRKRQPEVCWNFFFFFLHR